LTEAEAAFHIHKSDLGIRPVRHQKEDRVQAHILVAFWPTCSGRLCRELPRGGTGRRTAASVRSLVGDRDGRCGAADQIRAGDPQAVHQPAHRASANPAPAARTETAQRAGTSGNVWKLAHAALESKEFILPTAELGLESRMYSRVRRFPRLSASTTSRGLAVSTGRGHWVFGGLAAAASCGFRWDSGVLRTACDGWTVAQKASGVALTLITNPTRRSPLTMRWWTCILQGVREP